MDILRLGQGALALGAILVAISGIFAAVLWIHAARYAETMAAFNGRLRMRHLGKVLGVAGGTLALGGVCLLLVDVLARERRPYEFELDARSDAVVVVPRGAPTITTREEAQRRLSELGANISVLSDSQREVSSALVKSGKSSLARKLAACRKIIRRLRQQRAVEPDFTLPRPPSRPARAITFGEGLSRGDSGG